MPGLAQAQPPAPDPDPDPAKPEPPPRFGVDERATWAAYAASLRGAELIPTGETLPPPDTARERAA